MIPLHDDNPTRRVPFMTVSFIIACVAVFFWQLSFGADMEITAYALGLTPAVLFGLQAPLVEPALVPAWATLFTSMFLHGGWMHLIGNMLYLWVFGNNVEDSMGHGRFIVFYLLCGLVAAFTQVLPEPASTVPMIGASGAVSGVLGAYLLLHPRARILVLIPVIIFLYTARIRAGWLLLFWFLLQLLNSMAEAGNEGGGVAWLAHVGGFVAGMVLIPFFKERQSP